MKKNLFFGGIVCIIILVVIGVRLSERQSQVSQKSVATEQISVVTSFYPLFFFAKEIAQEMALVYNITPSGSEPHEYEPTPQDRASIEKSDLLILNGDGLEAWGDSITRNIDPNRTSIIVAGEGLATGTFVEEGKTIVDPHVWLSPVLAEQMVDKITQGFVQADPSNEIVYRSNAEVLKSKLVDLDNMYMQSLSTCKEKNIVTSHSAFGYLAQAYGLTQVPIAGLSPDAEPSAKEIGDIVTFAKENNVKYIFFESLISPKLAQTIAKEVGAQTLVLNPIEGLTDEEVVSGENYFSVMQNNLINLKTALRCNE